MKKRTHLICALLLLLLLMGISSGCANGGSTVTTTSTTNQTRQPEEATSTAAPQESVQSTAAATPTADSDHSREIWEKFLTSGEYKTHLSNFAQSIGREIETNELEYAIYDVNADDVPELLIQFTSDTPFYNTWLFTLQKDSIQFVNEQYGYGQYCYSPSQNAVIGSPEWKPFGGTGYWPFYRLNGISFDSVSTLEMSDNVFYYIDAKNVEKKISEAEFDSYFADKVSLDWNRIGSLQKVEHSTKPDLAEYLGTDISSFVNMTDGMKKLDTTDGSEEYSNGAITVSASYDSNSICFISIDKDCDYSIKGIEYGMSFETATELATQSCRSTEENLSYYKYFVMDDGTKLSFHAEDEKVVDSINLFTE